MSQNNKATGMAEICQKATALLESILNKKAESITSVSKNDDVWRVLIEVLERKAIPDTQDILNTYELKLDNDMEFIEYKRIRMRHRGDMVDEEEVE
jgi:hypothetical protein